MKKTLKIAISVFACLSLTACGLTQQNKKSESESREASSLTKANSRLKHKIKKNHHHSREQKHSQASTKASSSSTSSNSKTQNQGQTNQPTKSQSEINKERGYDPNGNPLLPGQDHAAGSNPDGSPDAWVQAQDQEEQFDQQNGFIGPDGRFNDKGKAYYHLGSDY